MHNPTRHSVFIITAFFITSTLNYGFSVALSWYLSPTQFGVLGVAQSLLLLLALIVGSGFSWFTAYDLASSGISEETRQRFRTAWIANLVLGAIAGGALWAMYLEGTLPLGPAYGTVIPFVSLTVFLLAVRSVWNGAIRGLMRFGHLAINLIGEVAVKLIVGLGLVSMGWGETGVMLGFAFGALASGVHSLWSIRPFRLWGGYRGLDAGVVRKTLPLFLGMLGTAMMLNLDVLGLKLLTPAAQGDLISGYYQAAVILARIPVFLAQALTIVIFSYLSGVNHKKTDGEQGSIHTDQVKKTIRSWARFLLPIGLALILAPQSVLALFFPSQYLVAQTALRIAALGGLSLALVTLLNGVFQAQGFRRPPATLAGIGTILQIIVLVGFVPRYGELAAAISLVVAGFATLAGFALLNARRRQGFYSWQDFFRKRQTLYRYTGSFLILAIPLLIIPDVDRALSLFKLVLAGLGYMISLVILHRNTFDLNRPLSQVMLQFVQVLIGV